MHHYWPVQPLARLKRSAHERAVARGVAIVRKPDCSGRCQRIEINDLFALAPLGDCGDREDAYSSFRCNRCGEILEDFNAVERRPGVWHAANGRKSTRRRRRRTSCDRFLVFETWSPQV